MEINKSIKIESQDDGREREVFQLTLPFEIKIEERELVSLSPKDGSANENVIQTK